MGIVASSTVSTGIAGNGVVGRRDDVKARMVRTELGDRGGAIPQQCGVLRLIDFATGEDALPDMWIQRSGGISARALCCR